MPSNNRNLAFLNKHRSTSPAGTNRRPADNRRPDGTNRRIPDNRRVPADRHLPNDRRDPNIDDSNGSFTAENTRTASATKPTVQPATRVFLPLTPAPIGRKHTYGYFAAADSALRSAGRKQPLSVAKSRPNPTWSMSAGITVSKSFPIGDQSATPYNASAHSGQLTDYLPAFYFRLYKGNRLYVEAAVHANSPQYTRPVPLSHTGGDTAFIGTMGVYARYTDVTLQKLYYMDIPLSVHYRVIGPLFLGAGLQYSRLGGAIGQQHSYLHPVNNVGTDSTLGSSIINLKDSQAYKQIHSSDLRAFLEADLRWRRLTLGLQYQQGFSSFALPSASVPRQSNKNSSVSLHLSVDLWIRRRY